MSGTTDTNDSQREAEQARTAQQQQGWGDWLKQQGSAIFSMIANLVQGFVAWIGGLFGGNQNSAANTAPTSPTAPAAEGTGIQTPNPQLAQEQARAAAPVTSLGQPTEVAAPASPGTTPPVTRTVGTPALGAAG